ncbi:MAG TPA: hypothetical protein VFN51_02720 [Candidatus Saccharimonadales bacterium]|nr:hypothetical protein [Candidatus Saccharimonadales bacterium]
MTKLKYLLISLASAGALMSSAGIVNAMSPQATPKQSSGVITKKIFLNDRQEAAASVLKVSVSDLRAARKQRALKQLIVNAGLTPVLYHKKVRVSTKDLLESQGYTKAQIREFYMSLREFHRHKVND